MKTLILTSSGTFVTKYDINKYLPKKISECKIAYIITASKKVFDTSYIKKHKKAMDELNFNYNEIDIANKKENELESILKGYDIILVEGGNTYYLLKKAIESGFKNILKKLLEKGVVYIGSSAGSYIVTPSIITANWSERGYDRYGITDYTGMNLIPFIIKAHSSKEELKYYKEQSKNINIPIRLLTDKQAFLIQNDKYILIGDGKELKI